MDDDPRPGPGAAPAEGAVPELPPYVIEGARSSRSRCKTCRRKIDKGVLRVGFLIEGPYGTGYLWHHLRCAAKRHFERVEEAYAHEAWSEAKDPPDKVPALADLEKLRDEAEQRKKARRYPPWAELDPSGRAACKQCGETLPKGELRVVLGRSVSFGSQVRIQPIHVHPRCVAEALDAEDSATEAGTFAGQLRENSPELDAARIDALLASIGPLA